MHSKLVAIRFNLTVGVYSRCTEFLYEHHVVQKKNRIVNMKLLLRFQSFEIESGPVFLTSVILK